MPLLSVMAAMAMAVAPAGAAAQPSPVIRIDSGGVVGVAQNGVVSFKGIPYAAPPVGALRWQAPQPAAHWTGQKQATDYGHSCIQSENPGHVSPSSLGAVTSEDCLTLNVWMPEQHPADKSLPVMVWIHGGGNNHGSSADKYYDGTAFARDGVVLVSMNYRLGVFGFLTHPSFARKAPANFGLLDQLAALQWVQRNIAAFGGDPHNVTVFGESAGGSDVLALMSTHQAAGTFQRAIVESAGYWARLPSLSAAQAVAAKLDASQLRTLSVEKVLASVEPDGIGPVVDGQLLRETPAAAFADDTAMKVPLIIGTNSNEGSLLGPDAEAAKVVPELSPDDLDTLRGLYGVSEGHALAELLFRDAYFAMPARWLAKRASQQALVYLYRFDYVVSFLSRRSTVGHHGAEVPFVFNTWPEDRLTAADRQVGHALHDCWVEFARSGQPRCPQASPWPAAYIQTGRGQTGRSQTGLAHTVPASTAPVWMYIGAATAAQPVPGQAPLDLLEQRLKLDSKPQGWAAGGG